MSGDDDLYRLAELAGVEHHYRDAYGKDVESPASGIRAVLASLGYEVATTRELQGSLAWADERRRKLLRTTVPVEAGSEVRIDLFGAGGQDVEWQLTLESGLMREGRAPVRSDAAGAYFACESLPQGYHRLRVAADGRSAEATVIAAPARCFLPDALRQGGRGFGVTAQIYGLRSPHNFGVGDFSDVAHLADGAGRLGAAFLGLSPVHALFPSDRGKISPYSPSSRLFIDPLYHRSARDPGFCRQRGRAGLEHGCDGCSPRGAPLRSSC